MVGYLIRSPDQNQFRGPAHWEFQVHSMVLQCGPIRELLVANSPLRDASPIVNPDGCPNGSDLVVFQG